MSGVDELVAFLRAALDRDEQVARKAKAMRYELPTDAPWERERLIAEQVGGNSAAATVHRMIAVFANPDRVLAEVQAKQRILDAGAPRRDREETGEYLRFGNRTSCSDDCASTVWWEILKVLAQPYAGQDGWREEWQA